ncbi:phosphotransferase [Sphaerisporangium sp. NPDC051017]|uniref:phosphotransferase n=1 Tax=Sphaerisporangium sp. NPDC051017 TaxID=3154636 RepID=UPI00343EB5E9
MHADLKAGNLLLTDTGQVYVIDWGHATRGAAWIEQALLFPWLLQAGHSPAMAEGWLSRFPAWQSADGAALNLFADVNAAFWARFIIDKPFPWARRMADATRAWAEWRRP